MKEFIRFIKKHSVLSIYTTIITILSYGGFWLNSGDILTDTETYITHPADTINVFLRVGRFGLVLTKKLFSTEVYSSSMAVLYMMAAMVLLCLVFDFCINKLVDKKHRDGLLPFFLVFNGLYISSPVLIHQFYFTYQAFEMVFAFLLSVISAYLIFGWAVRVSKKGLRTEALHLAGISVPELLRLPLALIFMTWSFGTYQALVPYYIAVNSIFFLVFYLYGHVPEDICWLGLCLRLVLMFLLGFLGYLVLSKAIIYVRFGTFRTYLTDSYMSWGNVPLAQCISNILGDIRRLVFRELPVYSRLYVPVTFGAVMLSIYRGLRLKRKGTLWLMAGLLVMICSCFFMTFVLGNY